MRIGSLSLKNNLILAPMVRVSDPPFRVLCREQGASLAFSEMLFARAIVKKAGPILEKACSVEQDKPFGVQLAAFEPEILQEATTMVAKQADVIDLNLGCPVQKAERQGVGAVLLQKPDLVEKLVHAMRTVTEKPITAKMRLVKSIPKSVALAKCIERGGVNAITVHGRTKTQKRKGMIDFEAVKAIKESVAIPVINNGGVQNQNSLVEIQEKTGCDGFMLARSAIGNPGIFAEVQGKQGISKEKALKRYLELCTELNFRHFGRIKQQCLRFGHALNNKSLSRAMEKVRSSKELEKITSTF